MINLNDSDLMSAAEASLKWGKSENYVRQMFAKYPDKFPDGSIRKFGKQLVVTRQGMEHVTGVLAEDL
ncbi:helix-turn-helix domain-containing protein [Pediococcus pentosaceus]|uniref:helix-turn-helix domain-containing protein n=1 Tax=Pediococcus pentosaceus TaxID=1255 RepID=UPI0039825BA4